MTLLLLLTAFGATHCAPMTWNDESRMATIQSLVEQNTLTIDRSDFVSTGDKVYIDGHFYSDKPPAPALIGALVYWPIHLIGLQPHEGNSASYFLVTLLTVTLSWIAGTLAFFHSLKFAGVDAQNRLLAAVALGFGTIYFSWSTTFNNHELAASFLSIGFCFLLKARFEARIGRNLLLAGFFLSLAGACDIPTGIFFTLFTLYVIRDSRLRRHLLLFVLPLVVTVVPTLVIDYSMHGSIMPVQNVRAYFEYPGSPWSGSSELSGMNLNGAAFVFRYAFQTLVGPRGFLLYNPLLILASVGLLATVVKKGTFLYEGICITAGCIVLSLYYWVTTSNFGDWSYSIRWFVPLIPLMMFFLYPIFEPFGRWRRGGFMTLLCLSVVISVVGALNPWSPMSYSHVPFVANIKQFVAHFHKPVVRHQSSLNPTISE